jgi:hypothetical protein
MADDQLWKYFEDERAELERLAGGNLNIFGRQTYSNAITWVMGETNRDFKLRSTACMMFASKPSKYLITGRTKNMSDKDPGGGAVDVGILQYLPVHEAGKFDDGQKAIRESKGLGAFSMVNFTMVHIVSLLCWQYSHTWNPLAKQIYLSHGSKLPSAITAPDDMMFDPAFQKIQDPDKKKESIEITFTRIVDFNANLASFSTQAYDSFNEQRKAICVAK